MTLTEFSDALKAAIPASYQSAAPAGVRPCVVWSAYGSRTLDGDDRTQTAISKVQLDILAAKFPDPIIDAVTDLLYELELPYSDQGSSYDPDYGCFRTILQTEVAEWQRSNITASTHWTSPLKRWRIFLGTISCVLSVRVQNSFGSV